MQIEPLVERALERFGKIDILINNAGIGTPRSLAKTPPDAIRRELEVNLVGAILLTRAVLPGMLERRHGAIISIASVAGHVAVEPLYSATKFGDSRLLACAATATARQRRHRLGRLAWVHPNTNDSWKQVADARSRDRRPPYRQARAQAEA